jgi:hypothetical protein
LVALESKVNDPIHEAFGRNPFGVDRGKFIGELYLTREDGEVWVEGESAARTGRCGALMLVLSPNRGSATGCILKLDGRPLDTPYADGGETDEAITQGVLIA